MMHSKLHKILSLCALLMLAACTQEELTGISVLDQDKTPITVTALLDAGGTKQTRAENQKFDEGDVLIAYLRHVTWNGKIEQDQDDANANMPKPLAPKPIEKKIEMKKGNAAMKQYKGADITPIGTHEALGIIPYDGQTTGNTQIASDLTIITSDPTIDPALYWDDFSEGEKGGNTDLRTDGHYLESYYGYCYNGGTPYPALDDATGVLGWSVAKDQSASNTSDNKAFQHSDLLWSAEQTPIPYKHATFNGGVAHGELILPYTHAMSKVTINVTVIDGFADDYNFAGASIKLHEMFTTCTCKAPTYTLTKKGTADGEKKMTDITMKQGTPEPKKCTYEAIVVPSVLSIGNIFATITGLDGDAYYIPVTEEMLQIATAENSQTGWGGELTKADKEYISTGMAQAKALKANSITQGEGREMKSGVNYVLNVEISKQQITVSATLKAWKDVNADGKAQVVFNPDVTGKGDIASQLQTGNFDVYKSNNKTQFNDIIDNSSNYNSKTTLKWNNTDSKWEYHPAIYWTGQDDKSYFRALAPAGTTRAMSQGKDKDILWGYACDDDANNGSKVGTEGEVAITPRTGDVPLHFEHPMSKITVELETPTGDYYAPESPAVKLEGATIEITYLAKTGTLAMSNGAITAGTITTETAIDGRVDVVSTKTIETNGISTYVTNGTTTISDFCVIPQTIGNDAKIKIKLADGTTYSLQLNKCINHDEPLIGQDSNVIKTWMRGQHYKYTIRIEKEAITFLGMIKDWNPVKGGGQAEMEW